MAKAIHLKCVHDDRRQPRNLIYDPGAKAFWSGNWTLSDKEAEALVGGWIYFHVTKAEPSYYGGLIYEHTRVKISGVARQDRIKFRFQPSSAARGLRWRGQDHTRAWTGGLVEAAQAHEQEQF